MASEPKSQESRIRHGAVRRLARLNKSSRNRKKNNGGVTARGHRIVDRTRKRINHDKKSGGENLRRRPGCAT
jgi:hypothetical protein